MICLEDSENNEDLITSTTQVIATTTMKPTTKRKTTKTKKVLSLNHLSLSSTSRSLFVSLENSKDLNMLR